MKTLAQEGWVLKPNISKSHSELLDTDLAHVGAKIIPADFANVTIIDGPKIFQFKRVKDVSHTKISHENGSNKSMFRITLSDGNSTCSAMNLQPIPGLSGKVYPGTKFRIKSGGAQVLGGFLLLTPANCEVIGGRVEKLVENIEKNENISKKKSGEDGGPPKFVPFGSSANNGTAKLQVTLEKPGKQETDIQNGAGSNKTGDHDRNSRNDKNNSDRGQKGDYQKDRRGKSYEKRGQSTRSTDDHKGQSYSTDAQGSDDRGRNRNRGTHKSDFRGYSRGNYHNDDHQSNRDRSEDGSQGSGRSRGRGRDRGEDNSHSSGRSRGRGRNKGGESGRSRGRGRDRGDDSYSSVRSRGRDRGSRGKDRSGRDDHFISDRTQTPGFSLGDVLGDFPALGGASQTGGASQASEAVNPASEWSNSRGDGGSGGYEDRGGSRGKFRGNSRDRGDDDSGRSRGRGRGRGRDRDDYSPERARPTNFSLGDVMQDLDFPALGSDSPASGAGQAREEVQSGSDWYNLRDGGGSRGYDDRDGRDNRSRGRGRGSHDRGSRDRGSRDRSGRGSRRDDYSSGQSKPAVYKADLESDFPV
ncbi:tudor domain-containing protein 3-like [Bolinopsis microptera]|uniref:tudor domain-containing protein 3-like n=1 Tax=Bolinopsis microptera TaxID=2820187 RepID=UPI003079DA1A